MMKHPEQRVGLFVDVQNMYHSAKNIYNSRVNFKEILKQAVADRKLVSAIAYVITSPNKEENKSSVLSSSKPASAVSQSS